MRERGKREKGKKERKGNSDKRREEYSSSGKG
jgi:hypothetical protein